jgi:SAM-dependent methyltransferase
MSVNQATAYDAAFFNALTTESRRSADVVAAAVLPLVQATSVIDVGCGVGTWLAAFAAAGVPDYLGLDGDYVDPAMLQIERGRFVARDLRQDFAAGLGRRFDLAISVEVGEHLPPEGAAGFVANLVQLSDCVLFSAAAPYQGGTEHLNENWPEFWALHFRRHGYRVWDLFRPRLWNDERVAFWYRQNLLLFVREGAEPPAFPSVPPNGGLPLGLVHPEMLLWMAVRAGPNPDATYGLERGYFQALTRNYRDSHCTEIPPNAPVYQNKFNVREGCYIVPAHKDYFTTCLHYAAELKGAGLEEVVVYGAGEVGQSFARAAACVGLRILAAIDRNSELHGQRLGGASIISLAEAVARYGAATLAIASFSSVDAIHRGIAETFAAAGKTPRVYCWSGAAKQL